ncbi:LytTR family transcriptional regulator [Sediminibacterium roseum]|uniref:LytTR family transcriptional regulator n=1 Tax=Sediminibacterium roseum TaxID=1978412 RepID=A0ABW9ZW13_9BACT|nr:LytTR family DNA-binding domain-containing protein [Sediminibacterium roseum]NCI51331.1 LytTR family transcriptional regulator [Sediminibacterium roseum]
MKRCLVIDDNETSAAALNALLEKQPGVSQSSIAIQPYQIRNALADEDDPVDMVFTRFKQWNINDYQVFNSSLKNTRQMPLVVFLSIPSDRNIEDNQALFPYALKYPYDGEVVSRLLTRMQQTECRLTPDFLLLQYRRQWCRIPLSSIEMIESRGYIVRIHTANQVYEKAMYMKMIMQLLPGDQFMRVADQLILPVGKMHEIKGSSYYHKGRKIHLTFRYAAQARQEMELADFNGW